MAERAKKYTGPKLPATLGNVALKVSEYTSKDGIATVKGTQINNGDELTVQLMSPARAANMMKGRDDGDDRDRVRTWEQRFENRRELAAFADPENEHGVKPGGVILLNNTRLDFSDRQYYAQGAYGFVSDPDFQAALSGTVSLSKFPDGSLRLQVYQPDAARLISPSAKDAAQNAVKAAFDPRSPVGAGVMARTVIVSIFETDDNGDAQSKAFYMRSASFEADAGNGVQFQLSNGFGDTLKRSELDAHSGAAAAAIAASAGVPVQMVIDRMASDTTEQDRSAVERIYDAVSTGKATVAITPGYTIPIVRKSMEKLAQRQELFHSGAFSGAVAVAVRGGDGGNLERPAAYAVTSFSVLPKSGPENAPTAAKEAIKAHERLLAAGGEKSAAPENRPPTRFSSPGLDY
ncbi:hypothetical protein [Agrobacterium tumefaciens]|uniref:hypothetical protein n=1 Tax=Agrobacterium tumefaciens TaxID=358 RepID=UPI0015746DA2|nr:hypothetical protein [Agrobacterium tumefaciens]NSX94414.1 hypothetical protein [Agrobacterium tumefaciens]